MSQLHHASCVEVEGVGLLLRGPPGAGKSDLALRLVDAGGLLVADDQVRLEAHAGRLLARPAAALAGLLEIRGLGIVALPFGAQTGIGLVVDLTARGRIERLPAAAETVIEGIALPLMRLKSFEASAVAKLRIAAKLLGERLQPVETTLGRSLAQRSALEPV